MKSCYQILGLASDKASGEEIAAAFARLSGEFEGNADGLAAIQRAYATLSDPARRAAHDRALQLAAVSASAEQKPGAGSKLHWLGMASVVFAVAGYSYSTRPKPFPEPPVRPAIVQSGPAESSVDLRPEALPPVAAAAQKTEEQPVFIIESRPSARPQFVRPEKKPGFDAAYLAWSTYMVGGSRGRGSGVMVARDKILTNCHVVAGNAMSGLIAINSATGERVRVDKYSKLEDDEDVCLLNAPGAPDYPVQWGRSESLDVGANTHTVSFPGNEGLTWSTGQLLRRETPRGQEVLITSNYCRPGVSGGPLFDDKGLLMGITSAGRSFRGGGGECMSLTAETAQRVMYKPMVPVALAPTQYDPAMLKR